MKKNHFEQMPENEEPAKSKTQRKREVEALQKLGEQLVNLPKAQLNTMPMPPELEDAVMLARSIKARGGLRRQLQLIGKIMRKIDATPIAEAIAKLEHAHEQKTAEFHLLEQLRDKLVAEGDAAIAEVLSHFPTADRNKLRQLCRKVAKEKQQTPDSLPSAKVIFRYLKEVQTFSEQNQQ